MVFDFGERVVLGGPIYIHTYTRTPPAPSEKRSPYPVINLLRAREVDDHAAAGRTQNIGAHNEKVLRAVGYEEVHRLFTEAAETS